MKKTQLQKIIREEVRKVIQECDTCGLDHYMFFEDLKSIHRMTEKLMAMDPAQLDQMLSNGHDWAAEHMAEAKSKIDEVTGFFCNHNDDQQGISLTW